MLKTPDWREAPEPVWLACKPFNHDAQPFSHLGEWTVHFVLNGTSYTTFVAKEFVDVTNCKLRAFIVADYDNDYLIDLPAETLTSGPRLRVPAAEKDTVLQRM